jgi:hypothetical protein
MVPGSTWVTTPVSSIGSSFAKRFVYFKSTSYGGEECAFSGPKSSGFSEEFEVSSFKRGDGRLLLPTA